MLLSSALVQAGRNDEAEARFEQLISLCERVGDRVNLGGAYVNRAALWAVRGRPDAAAADLSLAVDLAREVGSPASERNATVNLAEVLHWSGRDDEALELAERSRLLEERFFDRPVVDSALLLARMRAMRGELAEATRHIAWIRAHAEPDAPNALALLRACESVATGTPPHPISAVDLGALLPDERLEVFFLRAIAARRAGDEAVADALEREAREDPSATDVWRSRFDALRGRAARLHAAASR
jgi:tetratricopeptide (TPR) repeat protein